MRGSVKVTVLGVAGIGCMIGAIFTAVKNAKEETEEELTKEETEEDKEEEPASKVAVVIKKVKRYWTTIAFTCGAIFCFTMAHHVSAKMTAAAVTAYKVAADTLDRRKEATKEMVGDRKESIISSKAAEKMMDENPVNESSVVITGDEENPGETLFYDPLSKIYFKANAQSVREAIKRLNDTFIHNGGDRSYISYKRFRRALKIHTIPVPFDEEEIGWNMVDGDIVVGFHCVPKGDDVRIALTYRVWPYYDFVSE